MQIVYLSNRPAVLGDTWRHVRHFMPWVERALVVAPDASRSRFAELVDSEPQGVITVVADEEISGLSLDRLRSLDHVRRNVTLRRAAVDRGLVEDVFVLSDDDYRPMRTVDRSFFGDEDGDVGYFSYELAEWPGDETDFDKAQHVTHDALAYLGVDHLAYGAHMPQLMRREYWIEAFDLFDSMGTDNLVDEWSLYFNLAQHRHPEAFAEPRPFETMCWPQYGAEWPWWVTPPRWTFENFYEDLYQTGHLFAGLPTALDPDTVTATNFDKITRWTSFSRAAQRLEFPEGIYNPWVKDSKLRKAYFAALRPLRTTMRYVSRTGHTHD